MVGEKISLTKSAFDQFNWQEVIENSDRRDCFHYNRLFFAKAREAEANGQAIEHALFMLLTGVTAYSLRSDSNNEPYNSSARVLDNVLDSNLESLRQIASTVNDAEMRARIADLLWVKKRDFP